MFSLTDLVDGHMVTVVQEVVIAGRHDCLLICSQGGDVAAGLAICHSLLALDRSVATAVTGYARGLGALIAACGAPGYQFATAKAALSLHDEWTRADDLQILHRLVLLVGPEKRRRH